MTQKLPASKYKASLVKQLTDEFLASGVEYTCAAAVMNEVRESATKMATKACDLGYTMSVSYFPIQGTRDILCSATAKAVHKHFYGDN